MTGTLLNCDEAIRFIEQIPDPVTKNLVNMAFVHVVKQVHLEKRTRPAADFDMLFFVTALKDFFAEHQVLRAPWRARRSAHGLMRQRDPHARSPRQYWIKSILVMMSTTLPSSTAGTPVLSVISKRCASVR